MEELVDDSVKLYCRNLWIVYGPNSASYFTNSNHRKDPEALIQRMRDDGHIPAAIDVNFELRVGEIFVVMGLSGSGKSTLVRGLSRLVEPCHGEVILNGRNILETSDRELIEIRRHKMGMVFPEFRSAPSLIGVRQYCFPVKNPKNS